MTELQKEIQLLEMKQQESIVGRDSLNWLKNRFAVTFSKSDNQLAFEESLQSIDFLCGNDFPASSITIAKAQTIQNVGDWFKQCKTESPIPQLLIEWWKEMKQKRRGICSNFEPNAAPLKLKML